MSQDALDKWSKTHRMLMADQAIKLTDDEYGYVLDECDRLWAMLTKEERDEALKIVSVRVEESRNSTPIPSKIISETS